MIEISRASGMSREGSNGLTRIVARYHSCLTKCLKLLSKYPPVSITQLEICMSTLFVNKMGGFSAVFTFFYREQLTPFVSGRGVPESLHLDTEELTLSLL